MMESLKKKVEDLEREEILHALRECGWVMARAARKLGITERMIGYKIMKYGIRKEETEEKATVEISGIVPIHGRGEAKSP